MNWIYPRLEVVGMLMIRVGVLVGCLASVQAWSADLLKPLDNSSQYQLSNLRQETDDFGKAVLAFDFKRTKKAGSRTYFVKGKSDRGPLTIAAPLPSFQSEGTMRLRSMFPQNSKVKLNIELYITAMHTIGEKSYVYSMVSNPVRIGNPGAPTVPREWTAQETAGYEKHLKEKPKAIKRYEVTAAIPTNSVQVPLTAKLTKGTKLQACYQNKWYPITTLEENADGSVFVRWDDWGEPYDCNMLRDELLITKSALSKLDRHPDSHFPKVHPSVGASVATKPAIQTGASQKPRKDYPVAIEVPSDSQFVPDNATLPAGTKLQACYASRWNPITHLAHNPDGTLTVRWDDYGAAFDCSMLRSQLIIKKDLLATMSGQASERTANRLWTDATGKFKVRAKLVDQSGQMVTLLTEAGKTVTLPLSKLSESDQAYLAARQNEAANPFE